MTQPDQMRDFIGKVASDVLGWDHVGGVHVWLEPNNGFEDRDKYNGGLQVILVTGERFGHVFSWTQIEAMNEHVTLAQITEPLHRLYEEALNERVAEILDSGGHRPT